jgi:Zn-dependent protease
MLTFFNPTFIIAILIALSVHEWAHGMIAHRFGDPTAEMAGRLTLNPLAHLDPIGTVLFLLVGFGWGKPVPINPAYFRHPKRDTAIVSLAGPASNLILAALSFALLALLAPHSIDTVQDLLSTSSSGSVAMMFTRSLLAALLFINLGLMAFNLLPVAPLDGSKVLQAIIPWRYEEKYLQIMRWGPYILLGLLLAEDLFGVPLLSFWIGGIMNATLSFLSLLFGRL